MKDYKLLEEKNGWNEFANIPTKDRIYLLNEEEYNGFILETTGYTTQSKNYDEHIYYIKTDIKHKNKTLEYVSGVSTDIKASVRKTKKWLDKNGNGLLDGTKTYQHKST